MRREQNPFGAPERRLGGQRLRLEHVEGGPRELACLYRRHQRVIVDEAAARGVHQDSSRLHHAEPLAVHETVRLVGEGHVQRHDVGGGEQLLERLQLDPELTGSRLGEERVVSYDLHPERPCNGRDVDAHAAQPHEPQRLAAQLGPGKLLPVPLPGRHAVRGPWDAANQRHEKGQRVLGRAHGVGAGRVEHSDSPARRRFDVDVVHAHSGPGDHRQARSEPDELLGDRRVGPDYQCVSPLELRRQALGLAGQGDDLELRLRPQEVQACVRHPIRNHYDPAHRATSSRVASSSRRPSGV